MDNKKFNDADLILLSRLCGISHDLEESFRDNKRWVTDQHASQAMNYMTVQLEAMIKKHWPNKEN